LEAIDREIVLRKKYLEGQEIQSIYFGGGTPSLVDLKELEQLLQAIYTHHPVANDAEITLESNPDDLTEQKLSGLKAIGINRLSIGIQSFYDIDLAYMHRAHSASEASRSLELALKTGFKSITVDLIYGTPTLSDRMWQENIAKVVDFGIQHLSCYNLTVEEKTLLHHRIKSGKEDPLSEEQGMRQFEMLIAKAKENGYDHYEISNFCLPGHESVHNSNYWKGIPYLGIGPSAHSFDGNSRQWNVANNAHYIKGSANGMIPGEIEILTPAMQYNEYILTGLRTKWGCRLDNIKNIGEKFSDYFMQEMEKWLANEDVVETEPGRFILAHKGKFFADRIASSVFWID
jgi:oxygen-independent coproporphyrinogen-3 oxidase